MMSQASPRILLVDDHPIFRRGLHGIIEDSFETVMVEEVGTASGTLALVRTQPWDVIVLDISLKDGDGLEVVKQIRELNPRIPVLMLSMHPDEHFARRSAAAGASGYLTKHVADTEVVTALSTLLRGERYYRAGFGEVPGPARFTEGGAPHHGLSYREFQVARMFGRGLRTSEIAAELDLSPKTVSTYRSRVLEKLQLRTNAELTRYMIQHKLTE